ncbi:MAG: Mrp/NBP35 family ATP-binding protein [Oscillospiraceae bacterium]|nr:Mrp/NBP35 family ATP-binding protein [Oscillospiraceae bacterium]
MSECTHDCSSCGQDCSSRTEESLLAQLNPKSKVRKVYAVVSGKGGVGKSTVTSMLAVAMQKQGHRTAILDADITGPSIPKAFALDSTDAYEDGLLAPAMTRTGIQVMSLNLLLESETAPVVWRGPVLAGAVKQFWTDVYWDNVDYMFVDMPPGTGDVPLTVFQSLPIDGIILVTTPQDLVSMIVAKAVEMAKLMHLPIIGIVENYAWLTCPDCGKKIEVFGKSHVEEMAAKYELPVLARLPIDPKVAGFMDAGEAESVDTDELVDAIHLLAR